MPGHYMYIALMVIGLTGLVKGQYCPSNWQGFSSTSQCFRFNTDRMTWNDARSFCQIHGGDLAKITTTQARNWLFHQLLAIKNHTRAPPTNWWIGLNNREYLTKWEWADGSPAAAGVLSRTWAPGAPNNANGSERCGEIVNHNKFNDEDCYDKNKLICSRDRGIPLLCDSDHGWQTLNGACYKVYNGKTSWNGAKSRCSHDGGALVTIDNPSDEIAMHDFAVNLKQPLWIGLYSQKISNNKASWSWLNGTALSTAYWHGNPHVDRAHLNTTCAMVSNSQPYATAWQTTLCNSRRAYVCRKPEGVCLPGWVGHRKFCYQFDAQYRLNFAAAGRYCNNQGAAMVNIQSASDEMFINSYITEMRDSGVPSFWIGLSDGNPDGTFKWMNGAGVTIKNWAGGHPRNTLNKKDCVFISTANQNGQWRVTASCQSPKAFVCRIPMGRAVKTVASTPRPHFGCPRNWHLFQGTCYIVHDTVKTWTLAQAACRQTSGADLVKFTGPRDQGYVNNLLKNTQANYYWIGLNDQHLEGTYVWNDDTNPTTYKNWAHGQPDSHANTHNCVALNHARWNDLPCSQRKQYICSKSANSIFPSTPVPTPAVDWTVKCGVGWESNPNTPYCYMFVDEPLSWIDALTQCNAYHGHLVQIETLTEQNYLSGRLQSMSSIAVWTGANDRGSEGGWKWAGGKPFAFLNWAPGQPGGQQGAGTDCVSMFTANAQWDDVDCNTRNGYVCEKTGRVPRTTIKTTTVHVPAGMVLGCRQGWRPYGTNCYLFMGRPSTWSQADTTCGRTGGKLASVLDRNENNFLAGNLHKTSHSWDGYWIGLNDQQIEMTFQWADRSTITYTNWNTNEPNSWSNKNEDCVEMLLANGKWNDESCSTKKPGFICKTAKLPVSATQSPYQVGCPQYSQGIGPYCYRNYGGHTLNYDQANNMCNRAFHGTLAVVNDRILQAFIASQLVYRTGYFWIGMSDRAKPGTYAWVDNSAIKYTNWYNTHTGDERSTCVAIRANTPTGLWENRNCTSNNNYICQAPRKGYSLPPPTTAWPNIACPQNWTGSQGNCYKGFLNKLSWMEAETFCRSLGGDLPSFHNTNNDSFIPTMLSDRMFAHKTFWIGFNDRDTEGGYKWSDGSPVEYTNWGSSEPNNWGGNEDCAIYTLASKQWNDYTCGISMPFICSIPRGTVIKNSVVPTAIVSSVKCGNDPNWMYYNSYCYMINPNSGPNATLGWHDARDYCTNHQSNLASIHTLQDDDFLTGLVTKQPRFGYWIGFNNLAMNGYVWSDNSPVDYQNWNPGEPNNYFGSERCGAKTKNGRWNDMNCATKVGYVCKKPANGVSAVIPTAAPFPPGGCANGFSRVPGGRNKCFYIGGVAPGTQKNWSDAAVACQRYGKGYDLASIEDLFEQEFVMSMTQTTNMWIGLNDRVSSNQFWWKDNSQVRYTNWDWNEPTSAHETNQHKTLQDCVFMTNNKGHEGRWGDKACYIPQAYICQAPQDPQLPNNTPPNSCKNGYQPYNYGCYKMSTDTKSWTDAQTTCKADGGHLTSINDIHEASFVNTLSRSKFGYWIGLSDTMVHGLYGWSDGWPVVFTNWGYKQPSYGASATFGCVKANLNAKWNDSDCTTKLHYACKISQVTPPPSTPPTGSCAQPNWVANGDYCYYIQTNSGRSWPEANFQCNKMGMQLASVHTKADNDFIYLLITQAKSTNPQYKPNVWLGLSKGYAGAYTWSDRTPVSFLYWNQGEPTNLGAHGELQECIEFDRNSGKWNDISCFTNRGFVCKTTKVGPTTPPSFINGNPNIPVGPTLPGSDVLPTYKVQTNPGGQGPRTGSGVSILPGVTYPNGFTGTAASQVGQQPSKTSVTNLGLTTGGIAGVVIGCLVVLVLIAFLLIYLKRSGVVKAPLINGNAGDSLGFENATYDKENESIRIDSTA